MVAITLYVKRFSRQNSNFVKIVNICQTLAKFDIKIQMDVLSDFVLFSFLK